MPLLPSLSPSESWPPLLLWAGAVAGCFGVCAASLDVAACAAANDAFTALLMPETLLIFCPSLSRDRGNHSYVYINNRPRVAVTFKDSEKSTSCR